MHDVLTEVRGGVGFITLNRPKALNALSLSMIRALTAALLAWREDAGVAAVAVRGSSKDPAGGSNGLPFGAFCAGGDIRFFHQAALAGNPELEDFFTEEYALNHLIHTYPKPYVAFMDGIVMGGGMGISQGASLRLVTERTRMAMPETGIGLFPDVGGGYFLSRCPGRVGEYLALTGQVISGADAVAVGLADGLVASAALPALWDSLASGGIDSTAGLKARIASKFIANNDQPAWTSGLLDDVFSRESVAGILAALQADGSDWARDTAALLRKRSPLMLNVVLEQIRRARGMALADDLRMERDLVRHCFHLRPGVASETVEGVRALAVDKDHSPKWNPASIEDVTPAMVAPFFVSPWPAHAHPLRSLA
ncbi:enoyl-CoA hydratase/isomerase family protein [Variovorax terrae]|uniref:Enoyl-CoA hydratase/isomerase family protein n=1 Tax=Variovorax terrae TaxID=2923278 RepID=A0A9X1VSW1_9BURK|nr:enoyl-CoA hydratase/isomerase family protein [Variovorax terrae]MCJ0763211.1 enoyl-CoA hydratase/isomerase family protein [Variovorax terrae]